MCEDVEFADADGVEWCRPSGTCGGQNPENAGTNRASWDVEVCAEGKRNVVCGTGGPDGEVRNVESAQKTTCARSQGLCVVSRTG